jgi:hypothetical protein
LRSIYIDVIASPPRTYAAVIDAFANQCLRDFLLRGRVKRLVDRLLTNCTKIRRDLVSQHFLHTEAEQMWRVAAIGSGDNVATSSSSSTWPTVASGAAVNEAGPYREVSFDIARTIT